MPSQLLNPRSYLLDSVVQVDKATPGSGVKGHSVDSHQANSLIHLQLPRLCAACSKEGSRFGFSEARAEAPESRQPFPPREVQPLPSRLSFVGQALAPRCASLVKLWLISPLPHLTY